MSRTKRIYNNPRLKKTPRFYIDDGETHWIVGIPFTHRSWICMGHCPECRDHNKDYKIIRKKNKEELRRELKYESY